MIYENVELYNVEELIPSEDGNGKILTRIPESLRIKLNDSAKNNALSPAGCEIRFNIKGDSAKIVLESADFSILEIFQGSFQISWHIIKKEPTEINVSIPQNIKKLEEITKKQKLPYDAYLTRIILPYRPIIKLLDIKGNVSLPEKEQVPSKKYLAYGSSITHGASSIRPTGSYAMQTAEILGVDLINLGFGGGAHCEKEMADYISERNDWDFATLEIGINMVTWMEPEEFKKRVEYFIPKIAKSHPNKYIFCIDMFPFYLDVPSKKENYFRKIVKNTTKNLNMQKLIYINGKKLLKNHSGLAGDLVHPSPKGMEEISLNLSSYLLPFLR